MYKLQFPRNYGNKKYQLTCFLHSLLKSTKQTTLLKSSKRALENLLVNYFPNLRRFSFDSASCNFNFIFTHFIAFRIVEKRSHTV